jgi:hypothetical protein
MDGMFYELLKQDEILRNYCNLRIEQFQLIRKTLISDKKIDELEMQRIVKRIDDELAKLNI